MPNSKLISTLTATAIAIAATIGAAADGYAPSSILSTGRWVKIHVDSTSVYRIPHSTLAEWGFADPSDVRVYGYGSVEQAHILDTAPDDLPPVAVWHSADAMYFYGEGDRRVTPTGSSSVSHVINYYSTGSNYFLTSSHEGATVTESDLEPTETTVSTHTCTDHRLPEELNINSTGVFFFSRDISHNPAGISFSFSAPDFAGYGYLGFRHVYLHDDSTPQKVAVTFSGQVTPASFTQPTHSKNAVENRLYSASSLKRISIYSASSEPFSVNFSAGTGGNFKRLCMREVYFMYSRNNRFLGPAMTMDFPGSATSPLTVSIDGISESTQLWDVTSPRAAVSLKTTPSADGSFIATLPASADLSRKLCAFNPGPDIPQPQFVSEVNCRNLHAIPDADYLIVTTRHLLPEAERLAEAHRSKQGLEVAIVTQDEVFDEFSSGSAHPNGLRKFVRMLRERPSRPLRYLLLLGASTFDSRGITSDNTTEHLIGYEVEKIDFASSETSDYATDLYFGLMTDRIAENLPGTFTEIPISIGRAPVISTAEARIFVDKSIAYLDDPRLAGRPDLAVLTCCEGNKDAHVNSSEKIRTDINRLSPATTCARIYNALYPFDTKIARFPTLAPLSAQLAKGPFLFNYTGHSGRSQLGEIINISDLTNIKFGSMPVTFLASCETTPIDQSSKGIGSKFFLHPSGPIALVGSGRAVFLSSNQKLNEEFVRQLTNPAGPERLGDVWRASINATGRLSVSQRTNNFCYNFLGDPALPVRRPDRSIRLSQPESESGQPENGSTGIPALTRTLLNGTVTLPDGSTDTSFNGTITITLYDAPHSMKRYIHSSGDTDSTIILDETPLTEVSAEVKNGRWSAGITPPASSREGVNRLTFIAYSTDGHIATGTDSSLSVCQPDPDSSVADTTAPDIELYIDSPDLPDGGETGPAPTLHATIRDSGSGIAFGTAAIGSAPRGVIDNFTELNNLGQSMRLEADGSATLAYTLPSLDDGLHSLTLTARDVAGNTARASVRFTVISTPVSASLHADSLIARQAVELTLDHNLSSTPNARLVIRDMDGNTVFSRPDVTFPFAWDFRTTDGVRLPDGHYKASAILSATPRFGSTPEIGFTLLRHPSE